MRYTTVTESSASRLHATRSLLFGTAVGDALGVPFEFEARGSFEVDGMTGWGSHYQPPGTWSDDTSLTLALADAIDKGRCDIRRAAKNFLSWRTCGDWTAGGDVFDIGNATANAISRLRDGREPSLAGSRGVRDNGNGSLMRIAPLVFCTEGLEPRERFELVRSVSSMTHGHPWSVAACFLFIEFLRLLREGRDCRSAYAELRTLPFLQELIDSDTLAKFDRILKNDIRLLPEEQIQSGGFVIDTLEAALFCLLNARTYRDAVIHAVRLGDDTDTTAAVTGAAAGLAFGIEAIPEEWLQTVLASDLIERTAVRLAGQAENPSR